MPSHLLDRILARREEIEGERKFVTFLFADVVGSTALGERLSEEGFRALMDGALRLMIEQIYQYEGTVAQLRGDEIFAFFGAPLAHEDDPERAVRAGLDILQGIEGYAQDLARTSSIKNFQVRITLNTGTVVVGRVGGDLCAEYTAMGDAVNTTSKLQSITAPGCLVVSDATHKLVKDLFDSKPLGPVSLKGKKEPVTVYEVTGAKAVSRKPRGIEGLSSPMVGREGELERLSGCLDALFEEKGQIVSIVGEAGIGKSRLVDEFRSRVSSENIVWLEARCLSYGRTLSYHLISHIMRQHLCIAEGENGESAWEKLKASGMGLFPEPEQLREVLPYVARLLSLRESPEFMEPLDYLDPESLQKGILNAVTMWIERVAHTYPIILLFDDLQWADRPSINVILELAERMDENRVMLLCVYRPERQAGAWQIKQKCEKSYPNRYTEVPLSPLSENESKMLISNLLRIEQLPGELRSQVLSRANGNPLFVEEIIRSLIDKKVLVEASAGRWLLSSQTAAVEIPPLLLGIVANRMDRLKESAKQLLQMASVVGRTFSLQVLVKIMGPRNPSELDDSLAELITAALIHEVSGLPSRKYSFKHELIREGAYGSLLAGSRKKYHRCTGEAFEQLFEGRLNENAVLLAHHFLSAEEWDKAFEYSMLAGRGAWVNYASEDSITFFSQALESAAHLDEPGSQEGRFEALGQRAEVHALLGRVEDERSDLEALQLIANGLAAPFKQAEVLLHWSDYHSRGGQFEESLNKAEKARTIMGEQGNVLGEARALAEIGTALAGLGQFHEACRHTERALTLFGKVSDTEGRATSLKALGIISGRLGEYSLAMERFTEARNLYNQLGNKKGESEILGNLGALHYFLGQYEQVIEYTRQAQELFQALGNRMGSAKCLTNLGNSFSALGEFAKGRSYHQRALHIYEKLQDDDGCADSYCNLGLANEALGVGGFPELTFHAQDRCEALENALTYYSKALMLYDKIGNRRGEALANYNLGSVHLCIGDTKAAKSCLQRTLSLSQELGLSRLSARGLSALARVSIQTGDPVEAARLSAEAIAHLGDPLPAEADEVFFTHFETLMANGSVGEAMPYLARAHETIVERAKTIRDDILRASFLAAYQEILSTWKRHRPAHRD